MTAAPSHIVLVSLENEDFSAIVGIPSNPNKVYADAGWAGWDDFLGNGWRPFDEARAFVRPLGLKSEKEWRAFGQSEKRPADIPSNPNKVYAEWVSCPIGWGKRDHVAMQPLHSGYLP